MLLVKIPPYITTITGIDTLTHAIEAYIGKSNTKETKQLSEEVVKLVFKYLYVSYQDGENIEARERMLEAAYKGGVAFSRAYVGNIRSEEHTSELQSRGHVVCRLLRESTNRHRTSSHVH